MEFLSLLISFVLAIYLIVLYSNSRDTYGQVNKLWFQLKQLQDKLKSFEEALEGFQERKPVTDLAEPAILAPSEAGKETVATPKEPPPKDKRIAPPPEAAPFRVEVPKYPETPVRREVSHPVSDVTIGGGIDWEKFTGARLFAWVGGFALFLGMAFLVKYSIDEGLISPGVRVALGFLTGAGTIVGGLQMWRRGYSTTAHALCAVGPTILYAVVFASYDFYGFIGSGIAFMLMILVTVASFLLAVRLDSRYIALLGLVGGFLTPGLLSSGEDNPSALFGYIAILDLGLVFVALRKRWGFLIALSAIATILVQIAWVSTFFHVSKSATAITMILAFSLLYAGAAVLAKRWERSDLFVRVSVAGISIWSMFLVGYLLSFQELAQAPGLTLSALFLLNLILVGLVWLDNDFWLGQIAAGSVTFLLLLLWTADHLTADNLEWALVYILAFATLHTVFPLVLRRFRELPKVSILWGNCYPILMLLLIVVSILERSTIPFTVWPVVLLIDVLAVIAAFLVGAVWIGLTVMGITLFVVWIGILQLPGTAGLDGLLAMMTFFALAFFVLGLVWERRLGIASSQASDKADAGADLLRLPVFSILLPFLLLCTVCLSLPLYNPAPVFGLGLLLVILLLGLVYYLRMDVLSIVALFSIVLLQLSWVSSWFDPKHPMVVIPWYFVFFAVFTFFPFLFRAMRSWAYPFWTAALAGPLQFFFIYHAVTRSMDTGWIGLLPGLFAAIYLLLLIRLVKTAGKAIQAGSTQLALFGGVALFFISLILPLQLQKEWLTIGWALEGTALVWLFFRIPHPGLKNWGLALLLISFVRLTLNPAVWSYYPRGEIAVFNWYLYAYGTVAASLFAAAWLWRPREERVFEIPVRPALYGLGTVLVFLLMNIEIADFFSTGTTLTFQFGESFAQDLAYSLAWALFGLVLLMVGLRIGSSAARLASLALITVTTLKLFLYDLWSLGQLYRVAAFVGLAVVLILVSALYQKSASAGKTNQAKGEVAKGSNP